MQLKKNGNHDFITSTSLVLKFAGALANINHHTSFRVGLCNRNSSITEALNLKKRFQTLHELKELHVRNTVGTIWCCLMSYLSTRSLL